MYEAQSLLERRCEDGSCHDKTLLSSEAGEVGWEGREGVVGQAGMSGKLGITFWDNPRRAEGKM